MINTYIANSSTTVNWGIVSTSTITGLGDISLEDETYASLTIGCSSTPELCCYDHYVFADAADSSTLKNDKSSFVQVSLSASPSVAFTIQKDDVDLYVISDNTYGTYNAIGAITPTNYASFIVDWRSVLNGGGGGVGRYRLKIEYDLFGTTKTKYSECFVLQNYSAAAVEGTVKFKWTQNGKILNNFYDFADFEFTQYIRVKGFFGSNQPTYEQTNIVYADRSQKQVQDKISDVYTFESYIFNEYLWNVFIYDLCLAEDIEVTDYNFYNPNQQIRDKKIRVLELDNFSYFSKSRKTALKIKFGNRKENIIKRNNF